MNSAKKLLFICSRNQWRSPTAEQLFQRDPHYQARSAGTSPKARQSVTSSLIQWADLIFVMEYKHRDRIQSRFSRLLQHKEIHVLDIPDEYRYMDPELISILENCLFEILPKPEA